MSNQHTENPDSPTDIYERDSHYPEEETKGVPMVVITFVYASDDGKNKKYLKAIIFSKGEEEFITLANSELLFVLDAVQKIKSDLDITRKKSEQLQARKLIKAEAQVGVLNS